MANTRDTLGEQATLDGLVARTLTSFEEDGVTTIHDRALYNFDSLTFIKMPNLASCGKAAFSNTGITEIVPDSFPKLTSIGNFGFAYCESLTKARFDVLSSVPSDCFSGCVKLKELILLKNSIVTLSDGNAFNGTPLRIGLGTIYVPGSLLATYKADSKWKNFFLAAYEDYPVLPGTIQDSWSEILAAEADGSYLTKYQIGDTKIQQIGDYLFDLEIVAFDKDNLADGSGKAHITWIAKHVLFKAKINTVHTNSGGWANCKLRSDLRAMLDASSADLKAAVKEVNKTYYNYTTSNTETVADTIWMPSMYEVGLTSTPRESSGITYDDVFTASNANTRIKRDMSNSTSEWWLRSAYSNSAGFSRVNTSGRVGSSFASNSGGVVPGLCT